MPVTAWIKPRAPRHELCRMAQRRDEESRSGGVVPKRHAGPARKSSAGASPLDGARRTREETMLNRSALMLVAGAAIFALDASAVSGQDTTRTRRPVSSRRIPVAKEQPGEVTVRVDTVTQYRTDTL